MTSLDERLARGEVILMDGGVSTEIQKHGVAMDKQIWSGTAHRDHAGVVRRVHEDYIRAGAQVITANTFATARHVLESVGLEGEFEAINRQAVEVAIEARDNAAQGEVWIAGSISSSPSDFPCISKTGTPNITVSSWLSWISWLFARQRRNRWDPERFRERPTARFPRQL